MILRKLNNLSPDSFFPLNLKSNWPLACEPKNKMKLSSVLAATASASAVQSHNDSSLWLPIDLILEDAMDGHHVMANSAFELFTGGYSLCLHLLIRPFATNTICHNIPILLVRLIQFSWLLCRDIRC